MQILFNQPKFNNISVMKNIKAEKKQNCDYFLIQNVKHSDSKYLTFKGQNISNVLYQKTRNFQYIYEQNKIINFIELQKANIPNLRIVYNKGVRGETLSSIRNEQFIPLVKKCGIDTIIDLRTCDYTDKFRDKCKKNNLKYIHIPIDKEQESDANIIKSMPTLFEYIKQGGFYIACAQGLHRTDIALAINYIFNPDENVPISMSGHTKNNKTDMEDIYKRIDSLYNSMTDEDKLFLKWPKDYDMEFKRKRAVLKRYSESF